MNRNPVWKYLVLIVIVAFGLIYATPNLFQAEPGVQVIGVRNAEVDTELLGRVERALKNNNIEVKTIELNGEAVRARLASDDDQTRAQEVLRPILGSDYPVALADIQTTPCLLYTSDAADE